jgi:hypothetical protein
MKHLIVYLLSLTALFIMSCVSLPPEPQEIIVRIEAPAHTEITFTVLKDCKDNWNFCKYK